MNKFLGLLSVLCLFSVSINVEAGKRPVNPDPGQVEERLPVCLDKNRSQFRSNNEEVIRWKVQTKNQYKDRALVIGSLVGVIQDRPSHLHLQVDMDPANQRGNEDQIEIIYNKEFGAVAAARPGVTVAACGDYITSRERSGNYPASPVGAIVHWVHASNNEAKHAHGFLSVDGILYGNEGDAKQGNRNLLPETLVPSLTASY